MKATYSLMTMTFAALLVAGCTRSMDYSYNPNTYSAPVKDVTVGVVPLEDKRSWVKDGDVKSQSFIMSAGSWKFGLTHDEADYTPVYRIIADIMVDELRAAGLGAKEVIPATKSESLAETARKHNVNYVLTGDVQAFEVMNDMGLVTIDARRQVNINLSLYNAQGALVDGPANYSNNITVNEGMGVMHSTNIDKLFNETLKPVMKRVAQRMQERVANVNTLNVKLSVNGVAQTYSMDVAGL
jgi:hypothetical protein